MSRLYYSPKPIKKEYEINTEPTVEKMNSFSTQPRSGQGILTHKGLYGEVNPNILRRLQKGKQNDK